MHQHTFASLSGLSDRMRPEIGSGAVRRREKKRRKGEGEPFPAK